MVATLTFALTLASPAIDFDHHPAPAPVIVDALAKKLGRNLVADEDLSVDILIVHLDDADPDNALEWIAVAIEGEWKEDGDKLRLTRSHETELRQESEELSAAARFYQNQLRSLPTPEPLDKQSAQLLADVIFANQGGSAYPHIERQDLIERTPANRLCLRIAKLMDFLQFSDLPLGTDLYVPIADKRLPPSLPQLLADFEREETVYRTALVTRGLLDFYQLPYDAQHGDWESGPLRGALRITNNFGALDMSLVLQWGDRGRSLQLHPRIPYRNWVDESPKREEWNVPTSVNPTANLYLKLRNPNRYGADGHVEVPSAVLDFFLKDPDFDLLALGAADVTTQAAKLLSRNLVANLPDDSFLAVRKLGYRQNTVLQEVLNSLLHPTIVEMVEQERVLILRPARPFSARLERIGRSTARSIVAEALKDRSNFAVYATALSKVPPTLMLFDPRELLSSVTRFVHIKEGTRGELALRLFGSLSTSQQEASKQRDILIPWDSLPRAEQKLWLYVVASEGWIGSPVPVDFQEGTASEPIASSLVQLRQSYDREQPSGLVLRTNEKRVLFGANELERIPLQSIEGTSFDSMIASKELANDFWQVDRFIFLPRIHVQVKIAYGEKRFDVASYSEAFFKEGLETIGYSDIPKELIEARRAQIDEAKVAQRGNIPPD
jgi:hypothetical protein